MPVIRAFFAIIVSNCAMAVLITRALRLANKKPRKADLSHAKDGLSGYKNLSNFPLRFSPEEAIRDECW
jgi:hypothetical protein